jgi:hypothetical protein
MPAAKHPGDATGLIAPKATTACEHSTLEKQNTQHMESYLIFMMGESVRTHLGRHIPYLDRAVGRCTGQGLTVCLVPTEAHDSSLVAAGEKSTGRLLARLLLFLGFQNTTCSIYIHSLSWHTWHSQSLT